MKIATEIFKEHYKKRTGKDCDAAILHDMDYCIRAMHEYAEQYINVYEGKKVIKSVCDVCGSDDIIEAPHMGKNCNQCHPL